MKIIVLILLAMQVIPCAVAAERIRYVGSSTIGNFITDAALLYDKACDIGGVAREVDQAWLTRGLVPILIGRDAIAAIVNIGNPISAVSSTELTNMFTGQIKNWSDLGGADISVKTYVAGEHSATRGVFRDIVMSGEEYAGVTTVEPDIDMLAVVGDQSGAIGQISLSFLKFETRLKPLRVDGEVARVRNPNYPISRPLYLVTSKNAEKHVKEFLDWVLSAAGQEVVRNRFVSVH
jgi:phosphate transport system substrate-binding protein